MLDSCWLLLFQNTEERLKNKVVVYCTDNVSYVIEKLEYFEIWVGDIGRFCWCAKLIPRRDHGTLIGVNTVLALHPTVFSVDDVVPYNFTLKHHVVDQHWTVAWAIVELSRKKTVHKKLFNSKGMIVCNLSGMFTQMAWFSWSYGQLMVNYHSIY